MKKSTFKDEDFFYFNLLGIYMTRWGRKIDPLQSGNTYCANIWEKKDSQIIIFYRYYVFALFESHIKQDIKWNGSIHQAPPAATCGKTNLNKLIEFLKLTGN